MYRWTLVCRSPISINCFSVMCMDKMFTSWIGKLGENKFLSACIWFWIWYNGLISSSQPAPLCVFLFISTEILFCFCVVLILSNLFLGCSEIARSRGHKEEAKRVCQFHNLISNYLWTFGLIQCTLDESASWTTFPSAATALNLEW